MESLGPYELNTAVLGDCLEVMKQIPDNSTDSIVTDPPYGLGDDPDIADLLHHWLNDKDYDTGSGFMNKAWDVVPGPAVWRECYRVLKPGGCLMAFGGTRTCDLLSIAIRLAGFQRFDALCWLHGSGFAKGADISKKLDAMAGAEREVIGKGRGRTGELAQPNGTSFSDDNYQWPGVYDITAPATEAAALWSGWRSQLKPAHEVILCFWKPREKSFAHNALVHGVAGLWIDGCRIATDWETDPTRRGWQGGDATNSTSVFGNAGQPRVSHPNPSGRFPSNVLLSHHESCVRVGVKQVRGTGPIIGEHPLAGNSGGIMGKKVPRIRNFAGYADPDGLETVPDYRCHPDCPVAMLDRQAGVRKSGGGNGHRREGPNNSLSGKNYERITTNGQPPSTGSASRFYYTPKAPPREKWFYCEICDDVYPYAERDDHAHGKPKGKRKHQIAHPTVKPIKICSHLFGVLEYLCRLTKTPTGGIVLDPFGGSGTTALAAIANGRDFLIIENDPIYHRIAQKRIEQAMSEPRQLELL